MEFSTREQIAEGHKCCQTRGWRPCLTQPLMFPRSSEFSASEGMEIKRDRKRLIKELIIFQHKVSKKLTRGWGIKCTGFNLQTTERKRAGYRCLRTGSQIHKYMLSPQIYQGPEKEVIKAHLFWEG